MARKSQGPLTADERLAKIKTREAALRLLDVKIEAKATELKEMGARREEEVSTLMEEIRDEPEGELGFRDEEAP